MMRRSFLPASLIGVFWLGALAVAAPPNRYAFQKGGIRLAIGACAVTQSRSLAFPAQPGQGRSGGQVHLGLIGEVDEAHKPLRVRMPGTPPRTE